MSGYKRKRPPPREPNEEEKGIIIAVRHCARELDDMLQGARRKAQVDAKLCAEKTVPSLFRGMNAYADMYSKLKVKSRTALARCFQRSRDIDDMVDTEEAIEETEECWKGFLSNLDSEVRNASRDKDSSRVIKCVGDYVELSATKMIDCGTFQECNLPQLLLRYTSTLLIFQPSYLPDTAARCRSSEISKIMADFHLLNMGFVIITWGPEKVVKSWSAHLLRHVKWPVLWDRDNYFASDLGFKRGCAALWSPEMLDFCAYQSTAYKRSVQPPPLDIDWSVWNWVGGEVVIASPSATRLFYRRDLELYKVELEKRGKRDFDSDVEDDPDLPPRPKLPDTDSSCRICLLHRANNIAHMVAPGDIYKAALECFAASQAKSETDVVEEIRRNRRLATAPDSARLQLEPATGLYYDPETELHYDSRTGYFYDAARKTHYSWDSAQHRYVVASAAAAAAAAEAQRRATVDAARAAAARLVREQRAARAAGALVAAQLAAMRAEKDEYASYAYATCLPEDVAASTSSLTVAHASTGARILESLGGLDGGAAPGTSWDYSTYHGPSSSSSSSLYPPGEPPPPGV